MAVNDTPYTPGVAPPSENAELGQYIQAELREIARVMGSGIFPLMRLDAWGTLPPKPRNGDIAYFLEDVVPPPGGGEGLYMYIGVRSRWESIKLV